MAGNKRMSERQRRSSQQSNIPGEQRGEPGQRRGREGTLHEDLEQRRREPGNERDLDR
jgi:hypothetical protein